MFKFAIKNLLIKKVQIILIIISIMISASVAIISYNVSNQVSDGLTSNAGYYSLIIGPSGSETQLAMNTMYFTDEPLGTIPYDIKYDLLKDSRVREVIPFAMADSYNGYNIVATESAYLNNKQIDKGRMFDDNNVFEVVLGANVAKTCDVSVGDSIYTSHSVGEEHTTPFIVVGILKESYSSFDNIVFTELESIWDIHGEEHDHEDDHEEHEEHDHEEMHDMVCAFLVNTTNPVYAMQLQNEYNKKSITDEDGDIITLSAIEPMAVMRNVLEDTDNTKYIVYALSAVILFMNIIIISIITLLNMYQSKKEIQLMRLIGISMKKINTLYVIENSIIGFMSTILAFIISRLGLLVMKGYALNMGVVLNINKFYYLEFIILLGVFIISVLPTLIWTYFMSKKDGLE